MAKCLIFVQGWMLIITQGCLLNPSESKMCTGLVIDSFIIMRYSVTDTFMIKCNVLYRCFTMPATASLVLIRIYRFCDRYSIHPWFTNNAIYLILHQLRLHEVGVTT